MNLQCVPKESWFTARWFQPFTHRSEKSYRLGYGDGLKLGDDERHTGSRKLESRSRAENRVTIDDRLRRNRSDVKLLLEKS